MIANIDQVKNQPVETPNFSPAEVYRERCERFQRLCNVETQRWNLIGNVRLFTFLIAAAGLIWGIWQGITPIWIVGVLLLVTFFVLVAYHNKVGRLKRRYEELYRISDEAGKRLARRWDGLPLRHTFRAEAGDPYAADLNIFGHASLFQLVETVGTHIGEATLGRWLREFAPPPVVHERQGAVVELAPLIDLRDELTLRGRLMGAEKPDPAPFLAWAESAPWLVHRQWLVWGTRVSIALLWTFILLQAFGVVPYPIWFAFALANFTFSLTMGRKIYQILSQATAGEAGFSHYAASFELLSNAQFESPALQHLQATLAPSGVPAHGHMRRLHRLTTFVTPPSSQLYFPIQALTLWDVHLLAVFERWQGSVGKEAWAWLNALGEAEALSALAVLAHDNPRWAFPDVDSSALSLQAQELGHPLLSGDERVCNDVEVGPPDTFLLVTGSNMSGKSTLLRAIGVNIVLAGAGGPVCASEMRLPPVSLWTSMRIEDSLERGVSYFMAELQRLKRVVEAARACRERGDKRLFYLLDEILQGTNTDERQIAARRVIMYLVEQGALGAVSTHDLGLADVEDVARAARPVHFTETFRDGPAGTEMTFEYKLRLGIATSTNALRLMEMVGLDFE
jgi:ABC-type multidrug transport system fused ATPase/permease subunit